MCHVFSGFVSQLTKKAYNMDNQKQSEAYIRLTFKCNQIDMNVNLILTLAMLDCMV